MSFRFCTNYTSATEPEKYGWQTKYTRRQRAHEKNRAFSVYGSLYTTLTYKQTYKLTKMKIRKVFFSLPLLYCHTHTLVTSALGVCVSYDATIYNKNTKGKRLLQENY